MGFEAKLVTSALRQTCVGCGWEISGGTPFMRDNRDEPWHQQCHTIACKWMADAVAEAAQLQDEIARLRADLADARKLSWDRLPGDDRYSRLWRGNLFAGGVVPQGDGWFWTTNMRSCAEGLCATEAEAKAAAEKACGGDVAP